MEEIVNLNPNYNPQGVMDELFLDLNVTRPLYLILNKLIQEECDYLKKDGRRTQEDLKRLREINREQQEVREKISKYNKEWESNYKSPLEEILSNRTKKEYLVAENILKNKIDYPYKSDKVKALIAGGLEDSEIFTLMKLDKENNVTMSYIISIRAKLESS